MDVSGVSDELANIEGEINDILRALSNGFQKLEKIKDTNRQSRQLEELTGKMRECKRYASTLDNKRADLFDASAGGAFGEDNVLLASSFLDSVVQETINVGSETAAALKAQLVNPNNKDIRDIPGLAPPAQTRKLLWNVENKAEFFLP
ncbi:hypothetical protein ACLOJK_034031 [Asimina triloba]